jgi:hypothetical protein
MRLRPYQAGDRALTVSLETDPRVMEHLGGPTTLAEAEGVHRERLAGATAGELFFTVLPDPPAAADPDPGSGPDSSSGPDSGTDSGSGPEPGSSSATPEPGVEPIGVVAVWLSDQDLYELGVMFKPEHQARGLAEQAIQAVLPHLRTRGIALLHAFIPESNRPSHAVAMRVGFERHGERELDFHGRKLLCVHWILKV